MSRYLETAAEINVLVKDLATRLGHSDLIKIGQIVNLTVRSCPRGVQHTVRKNIVQAALAGTGCKVEMHEVTREGNTFHALEIT